MIHTYLATSNTFSMCCISHPFKAAKRKCHYCHDPLCPSCQESYGHHIFCGKHCHIKHLIDESVTQFWVLLKFKQLYVSSLIIILVAVLVGIPESSQPTWKGNIKPSEKSKTYQPSASKVNSDPTIYKYNLFSSVELPVEKTFHKIKAFNGNGVKDVLHLKRSNRKKRTSIMRLSDQPKIRAPIPVIKSRLEIKKVTKGLGEKLPLLM